LEIELVRLGHRSVSVDASPWGNYLIGILKPLLVWIFFYSQLDNQLSSDAFDVSFLDGLSPA
ncbi:MAG: hypothetical protein J6C62_00925, partial [Clostridia bacterium]|nr:hypothetical protein [Clostridia bacterium]